MQRLDMGLTLMDKNLKAAVIASVVGAVVAYSIERYLRGAL